MSENDLFGGDIVWTPSLDYVEYAHLTRFMQREGIADFDEGR